MSILLALFNDYWPVVAGLSVAVIAYFKGSANANQKANILVNEVKATATKQIESARAETAIAEVKQKAAEQTLTKVEIKHEIEKAVDALPSGAAVDELRRDWQRPD